VKDRPIILKTCPLLGNRTG